MAMFRTLHWYLWELSAKKHLFKNDLRIYRSFKTKIQLRYFSLSPLLPDQENTVDVNLKPPNVSQEGHNNGFVPYKEIIVQRRDQAERSLIVELSIPNQESKLKDFCSQFGVIVNTFSYITPLNEIMFLIEFEQKESVFKLLDETIRYSGSQGQITSISPFLKLNQKFLSHVKSTCVKEGHLPTKSKQPKDPQEESLIISLRHCDNMSEQIKTFYEKKKLTDLGGRLRFLACRKVEWLLPKSLCHICALPFGSSVNTFGHCSSDVDILLTYWNPCYDGTITNSNFPLSSICGEDDIIRDFCAKNLKSVANIMELHDPSFTLVTRILQARVPIIKCKDDFTGLECDISFANLNSHFMSELMYVLSGCDARVSPLVFIVKYWAMERKINNKRAPGRGISNFSLTLLTLFYLMNTSPVVIPSLIKLLNINGHLYAHEKDQIFPLTSLKDLHKSKNSDTLEDLLYGFFKFYNEFRFKNISISLVSGIPTKTNTRAALFLENPIERDLNVTINVNKEDLEYFRSCCGLGMQLMENYSQKKSVEGDLDWGLNCFFSQGQGQSQDQLNNIPIDHFFKKSMPNRNISIREMERKKSHSRKNFKMKR